MMSGQAASLVSRINRNTPKTPPCKDVVAAGRNCFCPVLISGQDCNLPGVSMGYGFDRRASISVLFNLLAVLCSMWDLIP